MNSDPEAPLIFFSILGFYGGLLCCTVVFAAGILALVYYLRYLLVTAAARRIARDLRDLNSERGPVED